MPTFEELFGSPPPSGGNPQGKYWNPHMDPYTFPYGGSLGDQASPWQPPDLDPALIQQFADQIAQRTPLSGFSPFAKRNVPYGDRPGGVVMSGFDIPLPENMGAREDWTVDPNTGLPAVWGGDWVSEPTSYVDPSIFMVETQWGLRPDMNAIDQWIYENTGMRGGSLAGGNVSGTHTLRDRLSRGATDPLTGPMALTPYTAAGGMTNWSMTDADPLSRRLRGLAYGRGPEDPGLGDYAGSYQAWMWAREFNKDNPAGDTWFKQYGIDEIPADAPWVGDPADDPRVGGTGAGQVNLTPAERASSTNAYGIPSSGVTSQPGPFTPQTSTDPAGPNEGNLNYDPYAPFNKQDPFGTGTSTPGAAQNAGPPQNAGAQWASAPMWQQFLQGGGMSAMMDGSRGGPGNGRGVSGINVKGDGGIGVTFNAPEAPEAPQAPGKGGGGRGAGSGGGGPWGGNLGSGWANILNNRG